MKTTAETVYMLVATRGDEVVLENHPTFKALSKAHHKWARRGWTVSLPV